MTILCTDKTGTLTAGRLTFSRAIRADDGDGSGPRARLAQQPVQTGFTNPLDARSWRRQRTVGLAT